MLFNIESDSGSRLVGYFVPDGFSGQPTLSVRSRGETVLVFEANEARHSLVFAGRHDTGHCGFAIDTTHLPELDQLPDLELVDVASNMLVYRRRQPHFIAQKILRLETHLLPLTRLDELYWNAFQYRATMLDHYGRETVTQMFMLDYVDSVYLSGRILHKNYADYAEGAFQMALIMHDPYVELAERLLMLRNVGTDDVATLGMRDAMSLKPAIAFAAHLPLLDDRAVDRAFRAIPPDAAAALSNPVVRQLTTSTPDEMPSAAAVASALDLLSSFAVVGLRQKPDAFVRAFSELTATTADALPALRTLPAAETLAERLRHSRPVAQLIDKDLELHSHMCAAFEIME